MSQTTTTTTTSSASSAASTGPKPLSAAELRLRAIQRCPCPGFFFPGSVDRPMTPEVAAAVQKRLADSRARARLTAGYAACEAEKQAHQMGQVNMRSVRFERMTHDKKGRANPEYLPIKGRAVRPAAATTATVAAAAPRDDALTKVRAGRIEKNRAVEKKKNEDEARRAAAIKRSQEEKAEDDKVRLAYYARKEKQDALVRTGAKYCFGSAVEEKKEKMVPVKKQGIIGRLASGNPKVYAAQRK